MSINTITTDDLRRMDDKDGLILQGCGGDLKEWVDGINDLLTEAGILKGGSKFEDVSAFQYDGMTCLLYPFEGVDLNIGKLAMWRLQTHENFGGTWLSDFVPNRLGGFIGEPSSEPEKPDCALIGQDGNIFNLVGIAARTLREHDRKDQAKEMTDRVFASGSYGAVVTLPYQTRRQFINELSPEHGTPKFMRYEPESERELAMILKRERFKRSYQVKPGNIKEYIDGLKKSTVRGQLKSGREVKAPHRNHQHKGGPER